MIRYRSLFDCRWSAPGRVLRTVGWWLAAAAVAAGGELPAKRTYHATRLADSPPSIDGRLDDPCWAQGEWAGDFTQREPVEGAAPTHPTQLKILYDNRNVYVAFRATDPEAIKRPQLTGQRDEFTGDMVGLAFDSYLNRQTSFEFDVTSGGSKIDLILRNDGTVDTNWNAIWDAKVAVDADGWAAEFRIPLSQLRYSRAREQVWGLHSWRWLRRKQEESNWQLIPMDNRGFVHAFGELRGIRDLPPSRRIELLPYVIAKTESLQEERDNPYRRGNTSEIDGGLDAKIGLSSDFTLDLTVNPDFGQVEADPSEINLSTTETFFTEKRPFFIEGKSMFDYALDSDLPFYTRRIGDGPSIKPEGPGFVKMPASNPILSAEKITGRTAGGLSLGLLHALTDRTEARITELGSGERREIAEPLTNYVVARVQNDFAHGDTILGGIFTATLRDGKDGELSFLPRQAFTGGLDLTHYWAGRTYFLEARGLATQVQGSRRAITELMENPVHNYQRPDADHIELDRAAEELTGHAGRVRAGKGSNGHWRYYGSASWRSPGVDFNDVGYLATADFVEYSAELQYYSAESGTRLRRRNVELRGSSRRSFGGELLQNAVTLEADVAGLSNWSAWAETEVEVSRLDARVLRGGPALRRPARFPTWIYAETDGSRPSQLKLNGGFVLLQDEDSRYYEIEPKFVQRLGNRLKLELGAGFSQSDQETQYAGQAEVAPGQSRYVMGRMDQKTLWGELRVQANFTPALSLTYFAGPYASTGRFDRFKVVSQPRAAKNADRFESIEATALDDGYEARWGAERFRFDDPDFDWRELNSNLVLKWEFRPGSTLYAVWSQHRTEESRQGAFSYGDEYRQLLRAHPDDTFLVKMSYWFSI
jgi:hypothetical protein